MTGEEKATFDWIDENIKSVRRKLREGSDRRSLVNEWKRWLFLMACLLRGDEG